MDRSQDLDLIQLHTGTTRMWGMERPNVFEDPPPTAVLEAIAELSAAEASPRPPAPSPPPTPPPWTHSCRITLTDEEAAVHCVANPDLPNLPPTLTAWTGRELLLSLMRPASPPPSSTDSHVGSGTSDTANHAAFSGVDLRLRVPPEEALRAAEKELQQSSTWTAKPFPDMGITFRGVPHLRIVDSVIRSQRGRVHMQPLAPLLQCEGCPYLTVENVTVKGIEGPEVYIFEDSPWVNDPDFPTFGPIHASGLIGVEVSDFSCTDIAFSQGWSCLHLQYNDLAVDEGDDGDGVDAVAPGLQQLYDTAAGEGFLNIHDSAFISTETSWGGAYGASALYSEKLYGDYDFNTGVAPTPVHRYGGYGSVLVSRLAAGAAARADAYKAPLVREATGSLQIRVYDSLFKDNYGNFGGVLAVLGSSRDYVEFSRCQISGSIARDGAVLYVNGSLSGLALRNMQIVQSIANDRGGVAFVSGSVDRFIVTASNAFNNTASAGGMLYAPYIDKVSISDSVVTENVATLYGGVIAAEGLGDVSVARSVISGNRALNGSGAVLYATNGFDSMNLGNDTAISGNTARDAGGV
ncbi:hypothetical protein VOLCADRAFT_104875 [Volvox carteri f. nagariensis]|uniref:Right handed beta helix domain-containing protein n=1 Tax=Volvox carteri f. nagariensis TaxID=3068 RepID=D8TWP1_VOLCA|nr:uncharacterized protein VOLCADRAFT_104875 [Volvox carteri f. nagariensis]EFJ48182.1 hypothetical protein VOLCADRAFT_104875 [Volvox carteri f. nagariensis]|eukprot:XP_002950867.1 hypothetical protein VOLCADRAFT_104875 [Volvox carteri f. nagariensis]